MFLSVMKVMVLLDFLIFLWVIIMKFLDPLKTCVKYIPTSGSRICKLNWFALLYHYSSHHLFELQRCLGTLYILDVVTKHKHTPTKTILRLFLNYKQFDSKDNLLAIELRTREGFYELCKAVSPFCFALNLYEIEQCHLISQCKKTLFYYTFHLN